MLRKALFVLLLPPLLLAQGNKFGRRAFGTTTPDLDCTQYGCRALQANAIPDVAGITGTIARGSQNLNVSTNSCPLQPNGVCIVVGDYVDVVGAGPQESVSTPSAPTGTPSIAYGNVGTNYVVKAPNGTAATRYYKFVGATKAGGFTAASSEVAIRNGQPLGSISVSNTSCSKSLQTTTCTSAAHALPTGCSPVIWSSGLPSASGCPKIILTGTSDPANFDGVHPLSSVPNSTSFTFTSPVSTQYGGTSSSTGGRFYYFNSNHFPLASLCTANIWRIYVYEGSTSGGETLYDVSWPCIGLTTEASYMLYDDFGDSLTGGKDFPLYVPKTPPSAATPDILVSQVTGTCGSNCFTLSLAASSSVTNTMVLHDDGPGIAAAAAIGGKVVLPNPRAVSGYIPTYINQTYNSVTGILEQRGVLQLNDTLHFDGRWDGTGLAATCPSINYHQCLTWVYANGAFPGIYMTGGQMNHIAVTTSNNGFGVLQESGATNTFFDDIFYGQGLGGLGLYDLTDYEGGSFGTHLINVSLLGDGSTIGQSDACVHMIKNDSEIDWYYVNSNRRGVCIKPTTSFIYTFDSGQEAQGPIMPLINLIAQGNAGGYVNVNHIVWDTSTSPQVANYGNFGGQINIEGITIPSANAPILTGLPYPSVHVRNCAACTFAALGQNIPGAIMDDTSTGSEYKNIFTYMNGPASGVGIGQVANPSTAPAVNLVATCPGGFPASGSYAYSVFFFDIFGNLTNVSHMTQGSPASAPRRITGSNCASIPEPAPPNGASFWWVAWNHNGSVWQMSTEATHGCTLISTSVKVFVQGNSHCVNNAGNGVNTTTLQTLSQGGFTGNVRSVTEATTGQCFSNASPAACGMFINGFVTIPAGSSSIVVDTTSLTANSEIQLTFDSTQGSNLGVTCNTTPQQPYISARTAGISFTISVPSNFFTNPGCIGFHIKN